MKRLLLLLGLSLLVVAVCGYWLCARWHASPQAPALRLSFQGTVQQVGPPSKLQLEVRSNYFAAFPTVRDRGVQSDRVLRMTNTGHAAVWVMGFNSSAPFYCLEEKRHGTWSYLPGGIYRSSGVRQQPRLNPGQSLDFPVIVPEGAESWRVTLVYDEVAPTNKVLNVVDRVLILLGRAPRPQSRAFVVRTEEVME